MAVSVRSVLSLIFVFLTIFALSASPARAQISITNLNQTYSQNFNGMGTSDVALTDDITGSLPGFYAFRENGNTNPNIVEADDGSGTSGGFKNYGQSLQLDRALGVLPDASTGFLRFGLRMVNDTGVPISSIQVTFTGEQWRNGGSGSFQTLVFAYRVDTNVNDLTTGVYTAVPGLAFVSPNTLPVAGSLNGNQAGNRATLTATFPVSIPAGDELMLRWELLNEFANNHGLAIDDLSVTAQGASTAAPATISGRVVDSSGRGIARTRVVLQGGSLSAPVFALTNPFGYYRFADIESGESYLLRVQSKRHRFQNPVIFVNLGDNVTGMDFVASP